MLSSSNILIHNLDGVKRQLSCVSILLVMIQIASKQVTKITPPLGFVVWASDFVVTRMNKDACETRSFGREEGFIARRDA